MSLIKTSSFDRNLVFELIIFLQYNDFQPPNPPLMGDFLSLGDTPRPLPERILDFFFNIHEIIWTVVQ
jgi:hypothetical protein